VEIRVHRQDDTATLVLAGQLDATWSEAVEQAVDEHVRQGARRVILDCQAVTFASSAGLGSLMRIRRSLTALGGSLAVHRPSDALRRILSMTKLDSLLGVATAPKPPDTWRDVRHGAARLQVRQLGDHRYRLVRHRPAPDRTGAAASRIVTSPRMLVLGVGALGHDEGAGARTGELVAIGGMAATLPSGGGRADFLDDVEGNAAPLSLVDGAVIEGQPSLHARFEACERSVSLSSLLEWVVTTLRGPVACVISGEIDGVIGMAARLPPGSREFAERLHDPLRARQAVLWFGEPAFAGESLHCVAVAMPRPDSADSAAGGAVPGTLAGFVRPMGPAVSGHAHAAITSFRAIRLDDPDPARVVGSAARESLLRTVLHLVRDGRSEPVVETTLRRGVIWAAALEEHSA